MAVPHEKIDKLPVVRNRVALSKSAIYKRISEGTFPRPIRLGPRSVGWLETDIDDWIATRVAESRGTPTD